MQYQQFILYNDKHVNIYHNINIYCNLFNKPGIQTQNIYKNILNISPTNIPITLLLKITFLEVSYIGISTIRKCSLRAFGKTLYDNVLIVWSVLSHAGHFFMGFKNICHISICIVAIYLLIATVCKLNVHTNTHTHTHKYYT